jgi:hypothetical protein
MHGATIKTKIDLTEAALECVGLIHLVQDTEKCHALVETAMYISLPYSAGNVLTS